MIAYICVGTIIGMFIGVTIGIVIEAFMVSARAADEQMQEMRR